jgi:hypothetical protein
VRRLVGKFSHPGPGTKFKELDPPKGLGEQVRKLILGVDVARLDAPFCQTVTDEVVPHLDVLAPFMEHEVRGQRQCRLAIHLEFHRCRVSLEEITEQSSQPERLSRSGGGRYVLSLAAGHGHHLLLDRLSADGALAEEEEDPACAFAGVDVAGVVAVAVPDKVCLPKAPRVVETVVKSPHNIADNGAGFIPLQFEHSLKGDRTMTMREISELLGAVCLNRIHLRLHHSTPSSVFLGLRERPRLAIVACKMQLSRQNARRRTRHRRVDEKVLRLSTPQRLTIVARVDALLVVGERGHKLHWVVLDTSWRRRGRSRRGNRRCWSTW